MRVRGIIYKLLKKVEQSHKESIKRSLKKWNSQVESASTREIIELRELEVEITKEVEKLQDQLKQNSAQSNSAGPIHMHQLVSNNHNAINNNHNSQHVKTQESNENDSENQHQLQHLEDQEIDDEYELNTLMQKEMTYEQLDEIETINVALKNQLEKTKLMREGLHLYLQNKLRLEELIKEYYADKIPLLPQHQLQSFFEFFKANLEESIGEYQGIRNHQAVLQNQNPFQLPGSEGIGHIEEGNLSMLEIDDNLAFSSWQHNPSAFYRPKNEVQDVKQSFFLSMGGVI